jgi:hypothetical protein
MAKATLGTDQTLLFLCPGCDEAHGIPVDGSRGWTWDGSLDAPTVSPSILVRSVRPIQDGKPVHSFKFKGEFPSPEGNVDPFICHSFVRAGRIEFLNDCTHHLAGQTVDLPDWE